MNSILTVFTKSPTKRSMSELNQFLRERFNRPLAGDLDAIIEFHCQSERACFQIHDGELTLLCETLGNPAPELVLFFPDVATAQAIVDGHVSPIDAFMRGHIRSNGHIIWVFQTLAAFSNPPNPDLSSANK